MSEAGDDRGGAPRGGPDRGLVLLLLSALVGGTTVSLAAWGAHQPLLGVVGIGLVAFSVLTLVNVLSGAVARARLTAALSRAREGIYRWQSVIQLSLVAVLFVKPPMAEDESFLDLTFDISGGAFVIAGLLLRLWAAGQLDEHTPFRYGLPTRFVVTGPYAFMRQPRPLSTMLIGMGLVLLAESGPGLFLVPAALVIMYRITIPLEEARLARAFGREYADYCRRVPRFPHSILAIFVAATGALLQTGSRRWHHVAQELPGLTMTLVLTVLAEANEFMPHLYP